MSYLQHCKSTDNHTNFMANKKNIKPSPINIKNKRASFDFEFIDTFTAGIVLTGTEIKSIRFNAVNTAKQIIVKAGTRLLIDRASVARLVSGIALLRNAGHKVLLVTSGAVGMGMELAGVSRRPAELAKKQALAALGHEIDRRNITLVEADKVQEVGTFAAVVKCYKEIKANINVEVVGEE
jgi:hypothetical protein